MDPKLKIVIAAVAGVLGGMLLLGTALAVPVAIHAVGRSVAGDGYGMMGPRGMMDRDVPEFGPGECPVPDAGRGNMMGPRGDAPQGGCGAGAPQGGCGDGAPQGGCGQYAPQDGTCPNLESTGTAL
jgi:hypothetical protein